MIRDQLHIHIMPRHFGDFEKNDDIYEEFDRVDILPTSSGHLAASILSLK